MAQTLVFFSASLCALTNPEVAAKGFQTIILSSDIEDLVFEIAWIFGDLSSTHDWHHNLVQFMVMNHP